MCPVSLRLQQHQGQKSTDRNRPRSFLGISVSAMASDIYLVTDCFVFSQEWRLVCLKALKVHEKTARYIHEKAVWSKQTKDFIVIILLCGVQEVGPKLQKWKKWNKPNYKEWMDQEPLRQRQGSTEARHVGWMRGWTQKHEVMARSDKADQGTSIIHNDNTNEQTKYITGLNYTREGR